MGCGVLDDHRQCGIAHGKYRNAKILLHVERPKVKTGI